ncbi:hypothetical protein C4B63_87g27 [Trypanosoma cruzi]|uniref:Uncharacterized protein n=1 Tax=Trypanosoma cruzi TaxID=5693 RepID=A0A2V2UZK4_TRYCR|nr:hypothetical protein C4B63_87g27 [Trypanosoma cruzi]
MREQILRSLFGSTKSERAGRSVHDGDDPSHLPKGTGFNEYLDHFVRMPEMLVEIEFYFALTMLGMAENLLSMLLLPLKCIVAFPRLERRDIVALVLIAVGMLTYCSLSLYATHLYAYLYHVVRRTSFIKLVMVFNILEVVDRLLSALSQEAIEVLTMSVQNWGKKNPTTSETRGTLYAFIMASGWECYTFRGVCRGACSDAAALCCHAERCDECGGSPAAGSDGGNEPQRSEGRGVQEI